jgi:hypothetical protein
VDYEWALNNLGVSGSESNSKSRNFEGLQSKGLALVQVRHNLE